jgi:hypothetical protein
MSLLGSLLSLSYMILISWYGTIISFVLTACLYKYIEYVGAKVEWGDGLIGLNLSVAQRNLLAISRDADRLNLRNCLRIFNYRETPNNDIYYSNFEEQH